jgi:hypothetical protein
MGGAADARRRDHVGRHRVGADVPIAELEGEGAVRFSTAAFMAE